jgi:dolichol-phosphate mannosyltransferase
VVDDNSPDGTGDVVQQLQIVYDNLHMIQGKKAGLGAAYLRGISYALEELRSDVIFEMDADFSHKPEDVPRLLSEIDAGADFIIGSRYVKGGSIPKEWGLFRRLNSLGGNIATRYIAGTLQVKDCTAGFRAIRSSLLRRIDLSNLRVHGYAFQIALLHAALLENAKVKEIPVDFIDRKHGESKLGFSDIAEFLVNVWWIRLESSKTFIKFAIVGALGVFINLGFFTAFLAMGLNKYIASPIAIEISIVSNFLFNNYWTFSSRRTKDRARIRGLKFNIVSLVSLALSYGAFVGLTSAFPDTAPQVHQLIGIVPGTMVNYLLNSYWTFRHIQN